MMVMLCNRLPHTRVFDRSGKTRSLDAVPLLGESHEMSANDIPLLAGGATPSSTLLPTRYQQL